MIKYIFILFALNLLSVEPIIKVPELPSDVGLEFYEDNEDLFAMKVLEYYDISLKLKTQIELLGLIPDEKFTSPTLEELSDAELEIIVKYFNLAKSLESQLINSDGTNIIHENNKLKNQLIKLQLEYQDSLWDEKNTQLIKEIRIKNEKDSLHYLELKEIKKALAENCQSCVNYFSLSVSENLFLTHNNTLIQSKPNLGVKLTLNASKILGFGKSMEFYYEYQMPRFISKYDINNEVKKLEWSNNLSSIGVGSNFLPIFDLENLRNGLKLGFSYFWMNGQIYNYSNSSLNWEGLKIDLEYYIGLNNRALPLEFFFGASLNQSFSESLILNYDSNLIDLNKSTFNLTLGIRYNFWTSMK